jgi:DNA-binding MarR family transcriptional regulator
MRSDQLIIALFRRFCWLDEGLQARLRSRGWPDVNRTQSMVMTNVVSGTVRPAEIARNLGISRQAIHSKLAQMVDLGMIALDVDPQDRRHLIISLTDRGASMRRDAQQAMDEMAAQIAARIGQDMFETMLEALEADWGASLEPQSGRPSLTGQRKP